MNYYIEMNQGLICRDITYEYIISTEALSSCTFIGALGDTSSGAFHYPALGYTNSDFLAIFNLWINEINPVQVALIHAGIFPGYNMGGATEDDKKWLFEKFKLYDASITTSSSNDGDFLVIENNEVKAIRPSEYTGFVSLEPEFNCARLANGLHNSAGIELFRYGKHSVADSGSKVKRKKRCVVM